MYYYPGHKDSDTILHSECTFSTPRGAFRPVAVLQARTCQLNHNSVRILPGPHLTPGSRAAMWIKCLAEGQKYRAIVGFEPGLSA